MSRWCWSWSRKEGDGGGGGLAEQQLRPGRCGGHDGGLGFLKGSGDDGGDVDGLGFWL